MANKITEAHLRRIFAMAIKSGGTLSNPILFEETIRALDKLIVPEKPKLDSTHDCVVVWNPGWPK